MNTTASNTLRFAKFGTVSHATLRTEDLLESFASELEWQVRRNGDFLSRPENFAMRDRLNNLVGLAQDAWAEDGQTLQDENAAAEMINGLQDALNEFAAPYAYFGAHPGDGSDFGYWPDIDGVRESVDFMSSQDQEYPADDFQGEWMHINERGNCTLYVRTNGKDSEIWSIV